MEYQAKLIMPFGVLGICCTDTVLTRITFLPAGTTPQRAANTLAKTVCDQLLRYVKDPSAKFTAPLELNGSAHQQKVWQDLLNIRCGKTRSYGELATRLHSSPRAIGQACGANPIPIIIPCHRVVSQSGLGGFMGDTGGAALNIKRWLLAHEQR